MVGQDRVRVLVPRLVGMEVVAAYRTALISGVDLCGPDPEQVLPLRAVISDQQPTAGTSAWSGDPDPLSEALPRPGDLLHPPPARRSRRSGTREPSWALDWYELPCAKSRPVDLG